MKPGTVEYFNWQLRYYYKGLEPEKLSLDEWASAIAHLEVIRQKEAQEP